MRRLFRRYVGGSRKQSVDQLLSKAYHFVTNQVAADDALWKPFLVSLVDDLILAHEVLLELGEDLSQRQFFLNTTSTRVTREYGCIVR